jgi:hypothetical protein
MLARVVLARVALAPFGLVSDGRSHWRLLRDVAAGLAFVGLLGLLELGVPEPSVLKLGLLQLGSPGL